MLQTIQGVVRECNSCQIVKGRRQGAKGSGSLQLPKKHLETISVDLFGQVVLPRWEGYTGILTIIERVANFVIFIPFKKKSAEVLLRELRDKRCNVLGMRKQIFRQ